MALVRRPRRLRRPRPGRARQRIRQARRAVPGRAGAALPHLPPRPPGQSPAGATAPPPHGGPGAKAGVDVLDRKQLLDRGLINLAEPSSSELLDLIESGSMP